MNREGVPGKSPEEMYIQQKVRVLLMLRKMGSNLTASEEEFLRTYAGVVNSQLSQLPQHSIDQAGTDSSGSSLLETDRPELDRAFESVHDKDGKRNLCRHGLAHIPWMYENLEELLNWTGGRSVLFWFFSGQLKPWIHNLVWEKTICI
ncbi:hypothetical protein lerEdw1_003086 [Lerista edwardsae]|nr:hypothetical protein lerEdw1_003086 [Lerista edwardsae]